MDRKTFEDAAHSAIRGMSTKLLGNPNHRFCSIASNKTRDEVRGEVYLNNHKVDLLITKNGTICISCYSRDQDLRNDDCFDLQDHMDSLFCDSLLFSNKRYVTSIDYIESRLEPEHMMLGYLEHLWVKGKADYIERLNETLTTRFEEVETFIDNEKRLADIMLGTFADCP